MLKKTLLVIFEDSRYGGPHSQFNNLAKILKKKINFKLLISKTECKLFEKQLNKIDINYEKRKLHYLSNYKGILLLYINTFFEELLLLINFLKKNKSKYLYIPGGSSSVKSVIAGIITRKKIFWHIHDVHSNIMLRLSYFIFSFFVYKIIFASKKSYEFYPNFFNKKKIHIFQSAVFKDGQKKLKKKKLYQFNVGMIANFNPIKNIEFFLRIIKKFKYDNNFYFYLYGQVWHTQKSYFNLCNKIILNNKIKNLKILSKINNNFFFKKIDLYICTSKSESSPLSIWEAVSKNIPVISTNVGDIERLNKKKKFAYVINSENENLFYKKIKKLCLDHKTYIKMCENSALAYKKFFDIETYAKRFIKLLD